MVSDDIKLSHYTLSALLRGCIEDKQYRSEYQNVWTLFVDDWGIEPNHVSYLMAITAASHCGDTERALQFQARLWRNYSPSILEQWHWNELLAAFGRCKDINEMVTVYETMKDYNVEFGDKYTMSIILNSLIRSMKVGEGGVHAHFDRFCGKIMMDSQSMTRYLDHYVFAAMMDGAIKSGRPCFVIEIWQKLECESIGLQLDFKLDLNCYGLLVLASYQTMNRHLVDYFVSEMKRSFALELKSDIKCWKKILTAYGHLGDTERMWMEYETMKIGIDPDVQIFCILITFEQREKYKMNAMNECFDYLNSNHCDLKALERTNYAELKGIFRCALSLGHDPIIGILSPFIMDQDRMQQYHDVIAWCTLNGERYSFTNLYGMEEDSRVLGLVDEWIERVHHVVDIGNYPEIASEREHDVDRMVRYHAEKKALAVLLNDTRFENEVEINVTLRMCKDCHRFFEKVSRYFPAKTIVCVDPKLKHVFVDGRCSCGKES